MRASQAAPVRPGRDWRALVPEGIEWLPALLIVASWLPRILLWLRRDYNHDDFAFAWGTWMRANGARAGVDLYGYGFAFLLVEIVKPLFRILPESFLALDVMRILVLMVQVANLFLVYRIVRRIGGSKAWALAACTLAAWQPDLIMRAEDVRTDPFGACCLLAAAHLLLGPTAWKKPERIGALLGVAIVLDYKFGVAAPFAAVAVVVIAWPRFVVPLLRLAGGATLVVAAYLGWLVHEDTWAGFLSGLRQTANSLQVGAAKQAGVSPSQIFRLSPVTFAVIALGAAGLLIGSAGMERARGRVYAVIVVSFFLVFLRLDPYFFPYNFNLFTPLLATMVPGIALLVMRVRAPGRAALLVLVLVCVTAAAEGFPALVKVMGRTNIAQKRVVRWIWNATAPDEHVFDWQGMHLNRPGIFHWWLFTGLLPVYRAGGWYSIAEELQRYRVTLLISTYRLGWLNASDRRYVDSHYVGIDTCLLAPGHVFRAEDFDRGEVDFEPPVDGIYRTDAAVPGLLVDGKYPGSRFRLARVAHRVGFAAGSARPLAFALVYSTPLRDRAGRPCPANEPLVYGFD